MPERVNSRRRKRERQQYENSRRKFLVGLLAGLGGLSGAAILAQCSSEATPVLPVPPQESYQFPDAKFLVSPLPDPKFTPNANQVLNKDQLQALLADLKRDVPMATETRITSIASNTANLTARRANGSLAQSTALMVDQSGLFLTAGHSLVSKDNPIAMTGGTVYHPGLDQSYFITSMIHSFEFDLGIVYAPTNLPGSRIPGVQLRAAEIAEGEKLRHYGITRENPTATSLLLSYMEGVSLSKNLRTHPNRGYTGSRSVWGMIPSGGTSGGPIASLLDGHVVAVESSWIANPGKSIYSRRDYIGAVVAPTINLEEMTRKERINILF